MYIFKKRNKKTDRKRCVRKNAKRKAKVKNRRTRANG